MYRSPASSSEAPGFLMLMVILGGAIHMAGCTDTPSDPELDNMPPVEDVEIEFATDTDLTASLIEDVSSSMVTISTDAAGQVLDAMRDGVSLRRVRHRAPGRTDARPPARPIPQGSDPTRRPSG